jgi:hypothetical protein
MEWNDKKSPSRSVTVRGGMGVRGPSLEGFCTSMVQDPSAEGYAAVRPRSWIARRRDSAETF